LTIREIHRAVFILSLLACPNHCPYLFSLMRIPPYSINVSNGWIQVENFYLMPD
jgi:hypothetical protein